MDRDGVTPLPAEHAALEAHPFGLRLDLRAVEGTWRDLFLSQHTAVGLGTWATWTERDGQRGAAFLPPGTVWALSGPLGELLRRLPGDAIELCYALAGRLPLLPRSTWVHPDGWWDEWRSRPVDASPDALTLGQLYDHALHPRVLGLLRATGLRAPRVVDVCGGDGGLAAAVRAALPGAGLTLIERNRVACQEARARIGSASVVEGDASGEAAWAGQAPVDVALLVGAVQGNVMRPETAVQVMRRVHAALRPGGAAIVTGWSPCLLDRTGFEALGFGVVNTAVPPTSDDPNPRQLYLLRRA